MLVCLVDFKFPLGYKSAALLKFPHPHINSSITFMQSFQGIILLLGIANLRDEVSEMGQETHRGSCDITRAPRCISSWVRSARGWRN